MMEFAIGNTVFLKSGSPPLTVTNVTDDDRVTVSWLNQRDEHQSHTFPGSCLHKETTNEKKIPHST